MGASPQTRWERSQCSPKSFTVRAAVRPLWTWSLGKLISQQVTSLISMHDYQPYEKKTVDCCIFNGFSLHYEVYWHPSRLLLFHVSASFNCIANCRLSLDVEVDATTMK
jgi:hypothetical protein